MVRRESKGARRTRKPFSDSRVSGSALRKTLIETLDQCGSDASSMAGGNHKDKLIAVQLDASSCVAGFDGLAFVAA